jgi:hypothetical protein
VLPGRYKVSPVKVLPAFARTFSVQASLRGG